MLVNLLNTSIIDSTEKEGTDGNLMSDEAEGDNKDLISSSHFLQSTPFDAKTSQMLLNMVLNPHSGEQPRSGEKPHFCEQPRSGEKPRSGEH